MKTLDDLFEEEHSDKPWGDYHERIRRDRIKLSVAAHAYEKESASIMPDSDYDKLAKTVYELRNVKTGNEKLDKFFRTKVTPETGKWIWHHPQSSRIAEIYRSYYK